MKVYALFFYDGYNSVSAYTMLKEDLHRINTFNIKVRSYLFYIVYDDNNAVFYVSKKFSDIQDNAILKERIRSYVRDRFNDGEKIINDWIENKIEVVDCAEINLEAVV